MADEANHRDVNHTFADMKDDDPNPFIEHHKQDAAFAWRLNTNGADAWSAKDSASGSAAGTGEKSKTKSTVTAIPINSMEDSAKAAAK